MMSTNSDNKTTDIKDAPQTGASASAATGATSLTNTLDKAKEPQPPEPEQEQPRRMVEVLVDNLGPKLRRKGYITDEPEFAALLDTPGGRALVREVKENC